MGYNISETSGASVGTTANGNDGWVFTADLSDGGLTTISGNFDQVTTGGVNQGEAANGYVFSGLNTTEFGTLSSNSTTGTFVFTPDEAALYASNSNQTITFSVVGTSGTNVDNDSVTINILICVARGTSIETARGPVPVETLAVGDMVPTRDNGCQPVRWIGSRRICAAELAADPSLRPVRLRKGALGHNVPNRDLLVSPQHRVLLTDWRAQVFFGQDEVLAPAKGLLNDSTVTIDRAIEDVEYFHILFDGHEIISTNGAATESFCPGPFTLDEIDCAARAELLALFPQLGSDASSYGPAARYALKVSEANLFARK